MVKYLLKRVRIFTLQIFKYKFVKVGRDFYCGKNLYIKPNTVSIGNSVYFGNYCHLSAGEIIIDDYVMLASYVSIIGGDHIYNQPGKPMIKFQRGEQKKVVIEKDVWVGHGTIIMHGVTLGEGCIIGAGSIVLQDIPPYSIVTGNPAKRIKDRFDSTNEKKQHSKAIDGSYYKNID
ncbi:MAG: antibiotic acetyltransferase [Planctomycetia bacterium]|nr:antibiotic acetyltransferase [Planctomycetia bacterium]